MPRPIEHSTQFEQPVERVYDVITDEQSLRERLAAVGGKNSALDSHEKSAGRATYRLTQGIAAEKLPGLIRRVHSGDLMVRREQNWQVGEDGKVAGTGTAEVSGVPGAITVNTALSSDGKGTKLQVTGHVKVSIPLIGGKIEDVIAEQVVRLLAHEDRFVAEQLAAGG